MTLTDPIATPQSSREGHFFIALYSRQEGGPTEGLADLLRQQRSFLAEQLRSGILYEAGQFADSSGAVAIFQAASIEHAERLIREDPLVVAGMMNVSIRPWTPAGRATANAATARRLFEAVERRDGPMLLDCYSENVLIHESPSLPYGGTYKGTEDAVVHARAFLATWGDLQSETERRMDPVVLADEERAVVLWRHRARHPGRGDSLDVPMVSVYEMESGKIANSHMFHFDVDAAVDFLDRTAKGKKQSSDYSDLETA